MTDSKLYARLRELRKEHGYSQESLAEELGVNSQAVKAWEKPKGGSDPKLKNLLAMCELYDCDLDFLIGRIETRKHDIKTVCEITGLSEKAVEKLTKIKPHRDLSDLTQDDFFEENGKIKLTKAGAEKVKNKKKSYSILVPTLSRLIEADRFHGLIMAYKSFLDSAEKLNDSTLEQPDNRSNNNDMVILSREDATRFYMRRVSDEITFICEEEFKKSMVAAMDNARRKIKTEEEADPEGGAEDDDD